MKDYSIKNTTKKERKEIAAAALGLCMIDSKEPSKEMKEIVNKYVEGEKEISEIQEEVLEMYKKRYKRGN
ncbi:antitoxin VbhA family protein [Clostridioides sp. ZZV14-6044]|uniref:antitoxin VbhA family protein n=1 Tax=Clostridioides sp. ZZV14-6044 TaxID=2811488 RepID=UPI001D124C07|nr:antitoxin VbhA family protein [Clostridioides sp. ZZV14-6044]